MGGLLDFLGTDNPLQQFAASNRGRLGQIGAGLASGQNFAAGLANAAQMQPAGAAQDDAYAASLKADAERQKGLNSTIEFMRQKGYDDLIAGVEGGGLDMGTAWQEALRRGSSQTGMKPIEINGQLVDPSTGAVIGDYRTDETAKGGAAETSLQPTWGYDASGNPVLGQLNKAGIFVQTQLPDGVSAMDPRLVAGERSAGAIDGKTQANARALLPSAQMSAQQTLGVINKMRADPQGLDETFGRFAGVLPQQWVPTTPGTSKANFGALLNQAKGKTFLEAFQSLKGGGAITEVEGLKAEQAIARLDTAQSKEAFLEALDDLETAVMQGLAKLEAASQGGAVPIPPVGYAPNSGVQRTSSGLQWSIEP